MDEIERAWWSAIRTVIDNPNIRPGRHVRLSPGGPIAKVIEARRGGIIIEYFPGARQTVNPYQQPVELLDVDHDPGRATHRGHRENWEP